MIRKCTRIYFALFISAIPDIDEVPTISPVPMAEEVPLLEEVPLIEVVTTETALSEANHPRNYSRGRQSKR